MTFITNSRIFFTFVHFVLAFLVSISKSSFIDEARTPNVVLDFDPVTQLSTNSEDCRLSQIDGECYRQCLSLPPNRTSCFAYCDLLSPLFPSPCDTIYHRFLPINIHPETQKNVVTFTLFGDNPAYYRFLDKVIGFTKENYPEWIIRFYVSAGLPTNVTDYMIDSKSEVILVLPKLPKSSHLHPLNFHGTLWRFFVADDQDVERYIIRDIDSYLYRRERKAVDEWVKEGQIFHILRDEPNMSQRFLAGMWGGIVNKTILNMKEIYNSAENYHNVDAYETDEQFLYDYVWPIVKANMICHKSRRLTEIQDVPCRLFPTVWKGNDGVGNRDAILNPHTEAS